MPHPRFNPLVETLSAPPIPEVQAWKRDYDGCLGPLIDLSQAVPGYPPHPDMLHWLEQAAGSVGMAGYGDIEGEPDLRDAYADWVSDIYAADIKPAHIQITSGCNQAFMAAMMAIVGPGDRVLLTNPCYFNHETTLGMSGVGVDYVDCHASDGFLPTVAGVDAMISDSVRALAVVTPNNPTGATYPDGLLQELFRLCKTRGIWMVVDETYRDFLPLDVDAPHGLFAQPNWHDTLIGLYSFSKSFCIPGHRVGAITARRNGRQSDLESDGQSANLCATAAAGRTGKGDSGAGRLASRQQARDLPARLCAHRGHGRLAGMGNHSPWCVFCLCPPSL